jgi:hypothetical protein
MSADQLKRAATKLRESARFAAKGPWTCSPVWSPDSHATSAVYSNAYPTGTVESEVVGSARKGRRNGGIRNPHNAVWIALMQPALAEPLAAWLDQAATAYDNLVATNCGPAAELIYSEAMGVARTILGEIPAEVTE